MPSGREQVNSPKGFFVVAAGGCKRHKGEEIEFFEHKIKNLKGYLEFSNL